jgi:hypothetical protein
MHNRPQEGGEVINVPPVRKDALKNIAGQG